MQVSGVHVEFDMAQPSGQRVKHLEVLCAACDIPIYRTMTDTEMVKVVITDFLGLGGDGYTVFKDKPHTVFGINDMQAAEQYIHQRSPIYPKVEWRLTLENLDRLGGTGVNLHVSMHLLTVTAALSFLIKSWLY
jgi:5'-nucleotidase, C-terminal domain